MNPAFVFFGIAFSLAVRRIAGQPIRQHIKDGSGPTAHHNRKADERSRRQTAELSGRPGDGPNGRTKVCVLRRPHVSLLTRGPRRAS